MRESVRLVLPQTSAKSLCAGGFEYAHSNPANRKRRRKVEPEPEGIPVAPCSWGIQMRESGPPGWGSFK
jgi:hypothetical protein